MRTSLYILVCVAISAAPALGTDRVVHHTGSFNVDITQAGVRGPVAVQGTVTWTETFDPSGSYTAVGTTTPHLPAEAFLLPNRWVKNIEDCKLAQVGVFAHDAIGAWLSATGRFYWGAAYLGTLEFADTQTGVDQYSGTITGHEQGLPAGNGTTLHATFTYRADGTMTGYEWFEATGSGGGPLEIHAFYEGTFSPEHAGVSLPVTVTNTFTVSSYDNETGQWSGSGELLTTAGDTGLKVVTVTKDAGQYKLNREGQDPATSVTLYISLNTGQCENVRLANATAAQVTIRNIAAPPGVSLKSNVTVDAGETSDPVAFCCDGDEGDWRFEVGDGVGGDTDASLRVIVGCPDIPAVSEWGLAALTLLVLAAGTVVLMRRRAAAA